MTTALVVAAFVFATVTLAASLASVWFLWRADRRQRPIAMRGKPMVACVDIADAFDAAKSIDKVAAMMRLRYTAGR
ncbi:hypothetical protein [Nocardia thailandica]|uniref:hypothetical protein n=1 Tax=Nocardia thailandica TaxID=257275 RepID=UPI0002F55568|nr:hypothetical protein [Nocardia thailandica]